MSMGLKLTSIIGSINLGNVCQPTAGVVIYHNKSVTYLSV